MTRKVNMASFTYTAKTQAQALIEGEIIAVTQQEAIVKILQLGQTPIKVAIKSQAQAIATAQPIKTTPVARVPRQTLAFFFRSLSELLDGGVALVAALDLVSKQRIAISFGQTISRMRMAIKDGASLSRAMQEHPRIFDALYVNMVKASESTGQVSKTLLMLSAYLEKDVMIRNRVRAALTYPMIILSIGGISLVVLMTFVLPKLTVMFEDFGAELPLPTRIVMGFSTFFMKFGILIVVGLAALGMYVYTYSKSPQGQQHIATFLLKVPLLGDFLKSVYVARFTRTVAVLLESGVPIAIALESSVGVLDNAQYVKAAKQVAQQVRMGSSLSVAFRSAGMFGEVTPNLVAVGEQGGKLESNLLKIATIHEDETQQMTETMLNLIGPVVLVAVVAFVGGTMLAVILPLIKMNMIIK